MRTYQPAVTTPQLQPFARPTLEIEQLLAIYARQSTKEQVLKNREAYDQQTIGLIRQATSLGWVRDRILVYIENKRKDGKWVSASGRLRIDQREGLQALCERIERDEVKTVLVWAVDRLFRDEDMIQPAVFAKLCKDHHCMVITMDDQFVFDNPREDARKRFLDAAQAAADYVTKHVKGRMIPAREQLSLRGIADCRRISVGYIVTDLQRYLPDGSDNPWFRRLVVYEPHAGVVRWLFRRYRQLGGNLRALYREICGWPCVFPFFEDPEHARNCGLSKNAEGYTISRHGLIVLLTNPVYIGWWYYKGQILSKTNHDPIVAEDDFWYAFRRLSTYTIDGEINVRPTSQAARYTHDGSPPLEALLDGIVTGGELPVYVSRTVVPPVYTITDSERKLGGHYRQSIGVAVLDAIFTQRLLHVLEHTEHGAALREHLVSLRSERDQQLVSVDRQIAEARQQIARWERSKRIAREEDDEAGEREAVRALKGKNATLRELELKQEQAQVDDDELVELMELLFGTSVTWAELSYSNRQRFIRAATHAITLTGVATHFFELKIVWKGPYARTDVGYIWRRWGTGGSWTNEENAVIRELYPVADRATILDRLPDRNWTGIMAQAQELGLGRRPRRCGNSSSVHSDLSLTDKAVCEALGIEYDETWPDKVTWWVIPTNGNSETPS